MPENDSHDERAAEYVLGQMDPRARAEFEARLAASPALRAEVQELETACEALALTAPQLRPSRRAWRGIVRRTSSAGQEGRTGHGLWADWVRFVWRSGWAVAACLALAWWLQTLKRAEENQPEAPSFAERQEPVPFQRPTNPGPPTPDNPTPEVRPQSTELAASSTNDPQYPARTGLDAREEARRMREWVQQLADEVADLHRKLVRETTLPPGANRLQLFRLFPTNAPSTMSMDLTGPTLAAEQQRALERWLAGALAEQLVLLGENSPQNPDPAPNDGAQSPNDPSPPAQTATNLASLNPGTANSTFEVVELASAPAALTPPPLGESTDRPAAALDPVAMADVVNAGVGFYSPDTGIGTITISVSRRQEHQTLQFWALDNESGGGPISLGVTDSSATFLMVNFSMNPGLVTNPGFFVTFEPPGGSVTPTGPVVVRPPANWNPSP
jgi:anti-sigma-K factor RskA